MGKKINLSHNLMGCRLDNWIRLKRSNPITEENKGQVRLITAVSSILAIPAFLEWLVFYVPIKRTKIKKDPVYIVGYWRSGTTFLQYRDVQQLYFHERNPCKSSEKTAAGSTPDG